MVGRNGVDPALGGGDHDPTEAARRVMRRVAAQGALLDETVLALSSVASRLRAEQEARAALERRVMVVEAMLETAYEDLARLHDGVVEVTHALVDQRRRATGGGDR